MNYLDLLIASSLADLAGEQFKATETPASYDTLPFANAAFFKESAWKLSQWHASSHTSRSSHPGLSLSSKKNQVAFGSSRLENRDRNKTLFVSPQDCTVLKQTTAFLLQYSAPLSISHMDLSRSSYSEISSNLKLELKRKLGNA